MLTTKRLAKRIAVATICLGALGAWQIESKQNNADLPEGYDAVQAAPESHKVLFGYAFVRVLEVPIPPVGNPNPRITIGGLVYFCIGMPEGRVRTLSTIDPMARLETFRAAKPPLTRAVGSSPG